MRVGIISVFTDYHRRGAHHREFLQPQIGPLLAALLPPDIEIEIVNDTWVDPDWSRGYDLLFLSAMHADFDRAKQISHYWRRRGAKTVLGGIMASTYPGLCQPYFDSIVIGDPEGSVARVYDDFVAGALAPVYRAVPFDPAAVPVPRYDLLPGDQAFPIGLEASRGCPFSCDFCALTAIGTRYAARPVTHVVRDILAAQRMNAHRLDRFRRRLVFFADNNIGGRPAYLRQLCAALQPLGIAWGACITFNVIAEPEALSMLSQSGCRILYFGLESFNPAVLDDMNKHQNRLDQTRRVIDDCRRYGILPMAGLVLSPTLDDCGYIREIPRHLRESGLHVPTFICFEAPFPGTPHFHDLAARDRPALLPDALLRDFTSYTLVTRPLRETAADFAAAYRETLARVYAPANRLFKLADDLPRFLAGGYAVPAIADLYDLRRTTMWPQPAGRTFIAGSDAPPPEAGRIPFANDDFADEDEWRRIMLPTRVSDTCGRVLPEWQASTRVFARRARMPAGAIGLGQAAE
jgi:hypothetical protein